MCDIYLSPEDHLRYSSDTGTLTDSSSLSFRDLVGAATSPSRMGTSYPSKNVVQECKSPPDYLKTTSKSSHHVVKMWSFFSFSSALGTSHRVLTSFLISTAQNERQRPHRFERQQGSC